MSRGIWAGLASAIALGAGSIAVVVTQTGGGTPAPVGLANMWIQSGAGTCTRSATQRDFASSATSPDSLCGGTWDSVYDAATAGDTVRIANGNYGTQNISGTKTSDVFFIGESQSGVIITGDTLEGSHYWMENVTVDAGSQHGWTIRISAPDITWKNVILKGQFMAVQVQQTGAVPNNFTWNGGALGDSATTPGERCGGSPNFDTEPIEVYDGTGHKFQNLEIWPQAGKDACQVDGFHEEDMRIHTANTLIEKIYFRDGTNVNRNAGSGKIFLSGSNVQNLIIRNVIFGPSSTGANNALDSNVSGCTATFNYNTLTNKGITLNCTGSVLNNIGPNATGVNSLTGRLTASATTAIDQAEAGVGSDYCVNQLGSVDFEGNARPQGSACDKGADEYVP